MHRFACDGPAFQDYGELGSRAGAPAKPLFGAIASVSVWNPELGASASVGALQSGGWCER